MQDVDCENFEEQVSDYIEGTLSPQQAAAMAQHAGGCADCRRDEAAIRSMYREMSALPAVEPPLYFRENVIAAIEREQKNRKTAWWDISQQWSRLTRTAVGAALATGVAAAVAWSVLLPHNGQNATRKANVLGPHSSPTTSVRSVAVPKLHMSRVLTMSPTEGPAYDMQVWLTGADAGIARFRVGGDNRDYRFNLKQNQAQPLRVPLSVAAGKPVIALYVSWATGGENHTRQIFLPVGTDKTLPTQQSFGLPDQTVVQTASDIAQRYGVPVTLDDVPEGRIQINARQETAMQTLERHLALTGVSVTSGPDGIVVTPQARPEAVPGQSTVTPTP